MSVDIQPASRICICYGEVDRLVVGRIFSEHEDKWTIPLQYQWEIE